MSLDILTFGCRLNSHESDAIRGMASHLADTVVVNTCAVTAEAERQARHAIARMHRAQPGRTIVVTGCAAQVAPQRWAGLPGVSRVLGNAEKLRPEVWRADAPGGVGDIMRSPPIVSTVSEISGRARALLQIQQGCDHRCTFCVIPFSRGPSRSVPMDALAARARTLVAAGHHEVVLTGVDIASYGADLPDRPRLGTLLRTLLARVPALPRLRLSSLDPAALDDDFWEVLATEPRLMPHLHLSLQAGSTLVLKRMRRRHDAAQAREAITRARALRPGLAVGADLIAGFPTETEALFEETLAFVREAALPYLHVFPYSERPGTPAARMPPVPPALRRARAARLREAGQAAAARFFGAQIGGRASVLTEAARDGAPNGHTERFCPVRLAGGCPPGRLVDARITAADERGLWAEPV